MQTRNISKPILTGIAAAVAFGFGSAAMAQQGVGQPHGERHSTAAQQHGGQALDELSQQNAEISTFVEALKTAGLDDSLTQGGQYTLLAPTNEAFDSMRGDIEELMAAENREELVALLRAHIVADDVDPQTASRLEQAQTLDGNTVDIGETRDGELEIGKAKVLESGIQQDNLRVYVIDEVLDADRPRASAREEERGERPSTAAVRDERRPDERDR